MVDKIRYDNLNSMMQPILYFQALPDQLMERVRDDNETQMVTLDDR